MPAVRWAGTDGPRGTLGADESDGSWQMTMNNEFEGLSEDEMATMIADSAQRSGESATDWATRSSTLTEAAKVAAKAHRDLAEVEAESEPVAE